MWSLSTVAVLLADKAISECPHMFAAITVRTVDLRAYLVGCQRSQKRGHDGAGTLDSGGRVTFAASERKFLRECGCFVAFGLVGSDS
jgi:hypothetical protein